MKKSLKGFTLIELLIVIVIIGILSVAFLPSAISAPKKARDAQRKSALSAIVSALEQYSLDNSNAYPATACMDSSYATLDSYLKSRETTLKDPSGANQDFGTNAAACAGYYYEYDSTNKCYIVAAKIEESKGNATDKPADANKVECNTFNPTSISNGGYFVIKNKL